MNNKKVSIKIPDKKSVDFSNSVGTNNRTGSVIKEDPSGAKKKSVVVVLEKDAFQPKDAKQAKGEDTKVKSTSPNKKFEKSKTIQTKKVEFEDSFENKKSDKRNTTYVKSTGKKDSTLTTGTDPRKLFTVKEDNKRNSNVIEFQKKNTLDEVISTYKQ